MLPKTHISRDDEWIKEQLDQLILDKRITALMKYNQDFMLAMLANAGAIDQKSKARTVANTNLRLYVQGVLNAGKLKQHKRVDS